MLKPLLRPGLVSDLTRCGPCKAIAPFYEQLSNKYPNALFLKVDVDECPETAAAYNVNSMPTFIFLRNKIRFEQLTKLKKQFIQSIFTEFQITHDWRFDQGSWKKVGQ